SQAPSTARGPRGPPRRPHPPKAPLLATASRKLTEPREKNITAEHRTLHCAFFSPASLTTARPSLAPPPASAHDVLLSSSPEDRQTLEELPEEVVLTFNNTPLENDDGNAVVVTGPDGESTYEEGELTYDGTDVLVDLTPLDEAGEDSIDYRIVSSGAHPIPGSSSISVTD